MRVLAVIIICMVSYTALSQKKQLSTIRETDNVIPGKVVVKLRSGSYISGNSRASNVLSTLPFEISAEPAFRSYQSGSRSYSVSGIDFSKYHILQFDKDISVTDVIQQLKSTDDIEYAEPIYIRKVSYQPKDPQSSSQNHLGIINAFKAWDISKGSAEIVVAIVDSGINYNHPDLQKKIYLNGSEIPSNGIDDDGDGYIDNYKGWDFAGSDYENIIEDSDPIAKTSNISHGTSVAGCAAAETDNQIGIAGVGFNTKYMAVKCSAENDTRSGGLGYILNGILGVIYAADHGADVINMSYGGAGYSQFEQDVMTYAAIEKGVVLVSAAGNDGINTIQYPAGYEHVLSVAATDDTDTKASFSSFGYWVDISAPGVRILTTGVNNNYVNASGTSFSSPIIAGAAALVKAVHSNYSAYQIRQLLIQSADDISSLNPNFDGELGKGRLNLQAALTISTPALRISEFSVKNARGHTPQKGETANISLSLINDLDSASAESSLTVTQVGGTKVALSKSEFMLGAIPSGETRSFDSLFSFLVPATVTYNEVLTFNLFLNDPRSGYVDNKRIKVLVNPIVTPKRALPYLLKDGGNFESDNGGFVSGQITGNIDLWELGVPGNSLKEVNSGTKAWKTDLNGNLLKGDYSCALQSPVFDFSDASKEYVLSFYKSMESKFCDGSAAVQLQYTIDGINWKRLGNRGDIEGVNWYNKDPGVICPIDEVILPDQEGWLGNFSNEYTSYHVSFLAGYNEVSFRFVLFVSGAFEGDIEDDGFMVDDFQVEVSDPKASFYAAKPVGYVGEPVHFKYLSNGADSYSWEFGDGGTSDEKDPSYTYAEPGVYAVSLTITRSGGYTADSTRNDYIWILPDLDARFGLAEGGDLESNQTYFGVENVSGTPFELGVSDIPGKSGTSSGKFAWVTGLEEKKYLDESEAYLYTPKFDFSILGKYNLSFWANYSFENAWDGFIVEYSINKGSDWIKLNNEMEKGWYDVISDPDAVFGDMVPIFSGTTHEVFEEKLTDVSFLAGEPSVAFRFKFLTDANTVDAGMALDDFTITGPEPGAVIVGLVASSASESQGCEGQVLEFTNASSGSVKSIDWNFGTGAEPETAVGPGPHLVTFPTVGSNTVTITATDFDDHVFKKDTTIVTDPDFTPEILNTDNFNGTATLSVTEGDSYRWLLDNLEIEGATEQEYLVVSNGTYSVEVTIGACTRTAVDTRVIVTSLADPKLLRIYPNPISDGLITIENLTYDKILDAGIYDLGGARVRGCDFEFLQEDEITIDVNSLNPGIYVLWVTQESKSSQIKIVIE